MHVFWSSLSFYCIIRWDLHPNSTGSSSRFDRAAWGCLCLVQTGPHHLINPLCGGAHDCSLTTAVCLQSLVVVVVLPFSVIRSMHAAATLTWPELQKEVTQALFSQRLRPWVVSHSTSILFQIQSNKVLKTIVFPYNLERFLHWEFVKRKTDAVFLTEKNKNKIILIVLHLSY